ncbi:MULTISPECIES: hypothetical protein [unclassified Photobacterium]|uniref:hypothetical protein n=1 Tax=unclassified Photobacterium TaxID=2628852 RepID=UPI001EDF45B4|nr:MULTISPECIES: hypothetical protein [unclassified Photobacterium]MCG3863529.1 hypothetical protein [Photobacterium sp. Ph6]MCG3875058.1 hypothetical protein [Photobacterium sp. Ph5]
MMLFDGYPDDGFKERFESKGISVGYQWFYKQPDYNNIIGLEISHFEHIDESHINVVGRIEYRGNQESCKGIYDGNIYYLVNKSRGIWEVVSYQKINNVTLRVPLKCLHCFSLT